MAQRRRLGRGARSTRSLTEKERFRHDGAARGKA
jgi:hypothetical protein